MWVRHGPKKVFTPSMEKSLLQCNVVPQSCLWFFAFSLQQLVARNLMMRDVNYTIGDQDDMLLILMVLGDFRQAFWGSCDSWDSLILYSWFREILYKRKGSDSLKTALETRGMTASWYEAICFHFSKQHTSKFVKLSSIWSPNRFFQFFKATWAFLCIRFPCMI